jgi:hypothetical protein
MVLQSNGQTGAIEWGRGCGGARRSPECHREMVLVLDSNGYGVIK